MKLTIKRTTNLPEISSASGIEIVDDLIYIISDDSLFLYQIDIEGNILKRIPLSLHLKNERISKALKPDYEAMTSLDLDNVKHLIIIGSGSVREIREKGILYNLVEHSYKEINLKAFYSQLKSKLNQADIAAFNIEGLCSIGEDLIFAQRGGITGNQILFRVNANDFIKYSKNECADINISKYQFELPIYENTYFGISGCTNVNDSELLFCASAENTINTYDDGPILGSLIGYIKLSETGLKEIRYESLNEYPTKMKYKLESVVIYKQHNKSQYTLLAVSDNDDGSSVLIEIDFKINT